MATLVIDCPHCGTKRASMVTIGVAAYPPKEGRDGYWPIAIAATCSTCNDPVIAKAENIRSGNHTSTLNLKQSFDNNLTSVAALGFKLQKVWPALPEPKIPAFVSPEIERAMLQAERNFPTVGNEEAAAVMYRRALELALKDKEPELKGTLAARIKKMVASHSLTPAIGEWADEIRSLGNDAAHDEGDVDREELTMIRGFTDAVLRYLYTLPAEVAARRKVPANAANPDAAPTP